MDVGLDCAFGLREGKMEVEPGRPDDPRGDTLDRPIVGYSGRTIDALRLSGRATHQELDFVEFSRGDFFDAVHGRVAAESLTRVLYPDDSTPRGGCALAGIFPRRLLAGRYRRAS